MRTALVACLLVSACSSSSTSNTDAATNADLAGSSGDMAIAAGQCSGMMPTDGQSCGTGCGTGTTCAGLTAAELKCYQTCDINAPACPCGRKCVTISGGAGGAACLPANTLGERCGNSAGGMPYGNGNCEQGLVCAGPTDVRFCVPTCVTSSTCSAQTSCKDVVDNFMVTNSVCWFNSLATGKAVGEACDNMTFCQPNALCAGGMCRQQCGGAADSTCSSGSCQPLMSAGKTFAYVCL
jgi:hypothetical protein